jgi:acyl carrier protein
MADRERIERVVYEAIDELNKHLPKGTRVEKSPAAALYGPDGALESLDFVDFIMDVESRVGSEFGIDVMLTDDDLLSKQRSPFATVGTLVEHLQGVVSGGPGG